MGGQKVPWDRPKTTSIVIRCTPEEKRLIEKAASDAGGLPVSRYILNLHHRAEGWIE